MINIEIYQENKENMLGFGLGNIGINSFKLGEKYKIKGYINPYFKELSVRITNL